MIKFTYEDIVFKESSKDSNVVKATFQKWFYFTLDKSDLDKLGEYKIEDGSIIYETDDSTIERKFEFLLNEGFNHLKSIKGDKEAVYIHSGTGIPVFGANSFGIIDRGSNILEVRPITGCNISCCYCSVNNDKRFVDYIVEPSYLAEEFLKLVEFKGCDEIEAHIGPQGEPLMYEALPELVNLISKNPKVKIISIDTNATMLTKEKIDQLVDAGLTRFNVSLNAINPEIAKTLADAPYDVSHVLRMIEYISTKANLIIAPVLVPKYNETEIPKIIEFTKSLDNIRNKDFTVVLGIQNYLKYKYGKNPKGKPWSLDKFYKYLEKLEEDHDVKLIYSQEDFKILSCKTYNSPFRKGDVIKADVVCKGRLPNEHLAVSDNNIITFTGNPRSRAIKLKITRTKHNIFYGNLV